MEEKDHLCRFDYNQFACILPETSPKAGLRLCEEIRAQIESHAYPNGNGGIHIQVNTCVVSTNHDGKDTVDSLIDAAYRSLAQNRGS
jgi:PleD family two-component response regulator